MMQSFLLRVERLPSAAFQTKVYKMSSPLDAMQSQPPSSIVEVAIQRLRQVLLAGGCAPPAASADVQSCFLGREYTAPREGRHRAWRKAPAAGP